MEISGQTQRHRLSGCSALWVLIRMDVLERRQNLQYLHISKKNNWIQVRDGRWWYRHADGGYVKNDWEKIGGVWFSLTVAVG